jgi:hypothetical protein
VPGSLSIRVVTSTVKNGRVSFNQVVLEQSPAPSGILFAAVDLDFGIHLWLRPQPLVAAVTVAQAPGYSKMLPGFDLASPPPELGSSVSIPRSAIDSATWGQVGAAHTNTLNKLVRELFGF